MSAFPDEEPVVLTCLGSSRERMGRWHAAKGPQVRKMHFNHLVKVFREIKSKINLSINQMQTPETRWAITKSCFMQYQTSSRVKLVEWPLWCSSLLFCVCALSLQNTWFACWGKKLCNTWSLWNALQTLQSSQQWMAFKPTQACFFLVGILEMCIILEIFWRALDPLTPPPPALTALSQSKTNQAHLVC